MKESMESLTHYFKVCSKLFSVLCPSCSMCVMVVMLGTNAVSVFGIDLL
jgi:hypothetical protein